MPDQTNQSTASAETPCSASEEYSHPKEWQDALDALYKSYSNNPTDDQKTNILKKEIGTDACCIHYCGQGYDTPEVQEETCRRLLLATLELDYLEGIRLYKPEYF